MVEVLWNLNLQHGRHICSGAYANNVECMYTSVPGHTIDYSRFIGGTYTDIVAYYMHMN